MLNGYLLLGKDWLETKTAWNKKGHPVPVMISVVNRIETAARIKHAIDHEYLLLPELCRPELTLQLDSEALGKAESQEEAIAIGGNGEAQEGDEETGPVKKLTKAQQAEQCCCRSCSSRNT